MSARLLPDHQLESSAVVANCRMNRERDLAGSNGYDASASGASNCRVYL